MKTLGRLGFAMTLLVAVFALVGVVADAQWAIHPKGAAGASCDICTDLVAYWSLDETSGTRADSVGSNDLSDNNTVGAILKGPSGTVASFNSDALSAQNVTLDLSSGLTFAGWYRYDQSTEPARFNVGSPSWFGGTGSLGISSFGLGVDKVFAWATDSGGNTIYANTTIGDTNWHWHCLWYDGSTKKIYLQIDDGTPVESSGTHAAAPTINTTGWMKFSSGAGYAAESPDAGQQTIGRAGLWTRVLTAQERTDLLASGNGLDYAGLSAGLKTNLVSWWELDESSGTRSDSHGANDLTDVSSVGSVINVDTAMDGAAASFVAADSEKLTKSSMATFLGGDVALSFWTKFKSSTESRTNGVIDMISGDVQLRVNFGTQPDTNMAVTVSLGDGAGTADSGGGYKCSEDTNWHHWILQRDGTTATIYRDGSDNWMCVGNESFTSDNFAAIPADFVLGFTSLYANLYIDEVAIWSRVLTTDERTDLYNSGTGKFYNGSTFAYLFYRQPWRYAANDNEDWLFRVPKRTPAPLSVRLKKAS